MSRMPRLIPLVAAVAVVAGCGASQTHTANQAFVAKADPICKQISVERTAANAALSKAGYSNTKALKILARVAPGVASDEQQAVTRLHALQVPSSLTADWQRLLTGIQQLASDAQQIAVDAKANNLNGVKSLTASGRQVRKRLTTIAVRDGFVYCGRTS